MIVEFATALGVLVVTAGAAGLFVFLVRRRRDAARAVTPIPFDEEVLSARLAAVVPTSRPVAPNRSLRAPGGAATAATIGPVGVAPAPPASIGTPSTQPLAATLRRTASAPSPRWRLWLDTATVATVIALAAFVGLTVLPGRPAPDSNVLSFTGTPGPDHTARAILPPTSISPAIAEPSSPAIILPPANPAPTLEAIVTPSPAPPSPVAVPALPPTRTAAPSAPSRPAAVATPRPAPRPTAAPRPTFPPTPKATPTPQPTPTPVPLPQPAFSAGTPVGLVVTFLNTSLDATEANWDFGDGGSSTAWSPSHEYAAPGTYQVVLTVSNAHGSRTMGIPVSVP